MKIDWINYFSKYESFLKNIPLERYSELRQIKTVEQDLPKEINPMPLIYEFYWEKKDFVDFDLFFREYWKRHYPHIEKFKQKYFWGCTDEFVKIGFRARLYRTWISLLTQFHFMYLWNSLFDEKVEASADLDMKGIDGRVCVRGNIFNLQVKKVSYRKEAGRRIFERKIKTPSAYTFEIIYIVEDPDELRAKLGRAKRMELYEIMSNFFSRFLLKFDNGFVVFRKGYAQKVYKLMNEKPDNYTFKSIFDLKTIL